MARQLRAVKDPAAPALGKWSIAELAVHLSQVWVAVPALAQTEPIPAGEPAPRSARRSSAPSIASLGELDGLTTRSVQAEGCRDLDVLADRIETRATAYLASCEGATPQERRTWMVRGTEVDLETLSFHLLSETVVHGYDIARADGQPCGVERAHAALVIEGFMIPVIQALDPRALVDQTRAAGLVATYDIRLRGAGRHLFAFDNGAVVVRGPTGARVDCHLSVDPVAMLLVAWGRESQWAQITRGRFLAWGRKPWLGLRLASLLRHP